MRAPFSLLLCTLFALLLVAVDAKKTGKVLTTNEKAAASLQVRFFPSSPLSPVTGKHADNAR